MHLVLFLHLTSCLACPLGNNVIASCWEETTISEHHIYKKPLFQMLYLNYEEKCVETSYNVSQSMFQSLRYLFVGLSLQALNWCALLKSSMEKVLSSDFKHDAFWTFSFCWQSYQKNGFPQTDLQKFLHQPTELPNIEESDQTDVRHSVLCYCQWYDCSQQCCLFNIYSLLNTQPHLEPVLYKHRCNRRAIVF